MTSYLSAIQNNYATQFPTDVPQKMAQGFAATTAIHLIHGVSVGGAIFVGTLACAVTIIEAVTRPIIRATFPQNPIIATGIQIFIPKMITVGLLVGVIAPWVGITYKVSTFIFSLLVWMAINARFYTNNVAMAEVL